MPACSASCMISVRSGPSGNQVSLLQGQSQAVRLPNGTYLQIDELDHLGPMTHPEMVAELIAAAL